LIRELKGIGIAATDGEIGSVKDFSLFTNSHSAMAHPRLFALLDRLSSPD
jgi:hypothetical protein